MFYFLLSVPAQVDSRDYDETGVDIVEALELGKPDINLLSSVTLSYFILWHSSEPHHGL